MAFISASDERLDPAHVYLLGEQMVRGAMRVRLVDDLDPVALLRGEIHVSEPVALEQFMGGKPRDILGSGHAALFLVSDKFVEVLQEQQFTGWRTYSVVVHATDTRRVGDYRGFAVTARCGQVRQSEPIILPPRSEKGRAVPGRRGLYFDPASWDGSDIFAPPTTGHVFVLERVRDAIKRARLTNVTFDRVTEVEDIAI